MDGKAQTDYDWNINSKRISNVSNYQQSIGFDSAGHRYIGVFSIVTENGDTIAIDNNDVNMFEWTNEVNGLCLTGFAEVCDPKGELGKIFSKYFGHFGVEFSRLKDGHTRKDGNFDDISKSNADFKHWFIINNVEIVRRKRQFVVYRLYLIGIEWYGLASTFIFSNYNIPLPSSSDEAIASISEKTSGEENSNESTKSISSILANKLVGKVVKDIASFMLSGGASEDIPVEIFAIIKTILGSAFTNKEVIQDPPEIDDKSFKNAVSSNPINLHVCFGYNYSIMDAIKFLLNKLYYNEIKDGKILHTDTTKFIVYNEFENKYGVITYGENSEFIKGFADGTDYIGTWVSLFGSSFEALTEPTEQDFGSVVKKSTIDSLKSFFTKVYHYFTIDGFQKTEIKSDEIVSYYTGSDIPKGGYQKYIPKVTKDNIEKYFKPTDTNKFEEHGSQWSNDFTIYLDHVTNLINKDVLVLHTKGDITHMPGMHFAIMDDAELMNDTNQSSSGAKSTINKNNELKGAFNVVKVSHVVKPNSKEKDNFTERIYLSRNFIAESTNGSSSSKK